jgi:hypothetical protein
MAGLGRKVFNAGDVLTAAQVQGFLQDQVIFNFASSAVRGTTITSPSEGMFAYLADTNTLTFYDGAAWQNFPSSLSNVTIATSTFTGGTAFNMILDAPEENFVISAIASGGTVNLDAVNSGVTYYSTAATANWVVNLRASGTATLSSIVNVNDAITHTFLATQGSPAYLPSAYRIDGTAVTPLWQGGGTPTAGNVNSVDAYTLTVLKTAATPSYTVLASQTQFKA